MARELYAAGATPPAIVEHLNRPASGRTGKPWMKATIVKLLAKGKPIRATAAVTRSCGSSIVSPLGRREAQGRDRKVRADPTHRRAAARL